MPFPPVWRSSLRAKRVRHRDAAGRFETSSLIGQDKRHLQDYFEACHLALFDLNFLILDPRALDVFSTSCCARDTLQDGVFEAFLLTLLISLMRATVMISPSRLAAKRT